MNTFKMNNRRYLGSKYKLLPFLDEIIEHNIQDGHVFYDAFAGTGVVANYFSEKYKVIVNDTLICNYYAYECFLGNQSIDMEKIQTILLRYNNEDIIYEMPNKKKYYTYNFENTFLSSQNLRKLDYIRDDIDLLFNEKIINNREKAILITSLLYGIDKIANTVGHYDAYRQNGNLNKNLQMLLPEIKNHNYVNEIYNMDANALSKKVVADIAYIDPPYNSRQYCDMYHFLENVALNTKPKVFGKAKKMNREYLKSRYSTKYAKEAFEDLIDKLNVKYILLSYNNIKNTATARSNSKLSDEDIKEVLKRKGKVQVFEKDVNPYTTGNTNTQDYKERVFLCRVYAKASQNTSNQKEVQSPLNYIGGKFKLVSQLKKYFPINVNTFYDVFCGGFNVGCNVIAKNIVGVDSNDKLISLLKFLKSSNVDELMYNIEHTINNYKLSCSSIQGYSYYGINSSQGLAKYNREGFLHLRNDYNDTKDNILLLILVFYSFNNQMRFNNKGLFNIPVGKRDFNNKLKQKFINFVNNLQRSNTSFCNCDFRNVNVAKITKEDFIYFDPPYLLAMATYNDKWTEKDEEDLYDFILICQKNNIRFALSNVLCHKGRTHDKLIYWCKDNMFTIHHLNYNYNNANYQKKNKNLFTDEVLITNY